MKKRKTGIAVLLLTLLLAGSVPVCGAAETAGEFCTLSFINVGKGDAFVLSLPGKRYYMLDTGKKSDSRIVGQFLEEKGILHLNGVFLSHGHKDHAGGLKKLLKNGITVDTVYTAALDTVTYKDFPMEELEEDYGFSHEELEKGETVDLASGEVLAEEASGGSLPDMRAEVLGPQSCDLQEENNNSMLLMLVYKDTRFLMLGDAQLEEEALLLSSGADLRAQVLKTGHHGKDDATSPQLLKAVEPEYGIMTGSPYEDEESASPQVTARLRACGIREFSSQGDFLAIDFVSDGTEVTPVSFSEIKKEQEGE